MRKQAASQTEQLWESWTSRDPNERPLKWMTNGLYIGMEPNLKAPLPAGREDSVGIVGPPRVGKTTGLLIPQILLWLGPMIVASTKDDVLRATGDRRSWLAAKRGGHTMVYSPTESTDTTGMLRAHWSPLAGCEDPTTCSIRADTMLASAAKGVEDADFWRAQAASVLTAYFHAAAVTKGYGMSDVMEWLTTGEVETPAELLAERGSPDSGRWAQSLVASRRTSDRERASIWAVAKSGLAVFDSAVVLDNSATTDWFIAPQAFLSSCSTLYIVAPPEHQAVTAPLIAALIESMVAGAIGMARLSPGGRLDPPLLLLLDEVANIAPLPSLPSILSQGGSQGVLVSWAAQSLSQLRARWGQDVAETIWDSSRTKLIFGGLSDQRDLETISRISGEVMVDVGNGLTQPRPRLPVDYLANLPPGYAVVSSVGKPPTPLEIPGVHQVPLFAGELGWHAPATTRFERRRWQAGLTSADELDTAQHPSPSGTEDFLPDISVTQPPALIVSGGNELQEAVPTTSIVLGTFVSPLGATRVVGTGTGTSTLRIVSQEGTAPYILDALEDWSYAPAIVLTADRTLVDTISDALSDDRPPAIYDPGQTSTPRPHAYGWNPVSVDYWDQWLAISHLAEMNILFGGCLWAAAIAQRALEDVDAWMEMDQFAPALGAVRSFVAQHPERNTPFFQRFASLVEGPANDRADQRSSARAVLSWLAPQVRAYYDAHMPFLVPDEWAKNRGVLIGVISDRHSSQCVRAVADIVGRAAHDAGQPTLVIHDRLNEDEKVLSVSSPPADPCRLVLEDALDPIHTPWGSATHQLIDLPIMDRRILARVESQLSEFAPPPTENRKTMLLLSTSLARPCLLHPRGRPGAGQ